MLVKYEVPERPGKFIPQNCCLETFDMRTNGIVVLPASNISLKDLSVDDLVVNSINTVFAQID